MQYTLFLGGHDLEMQEIARLISELKNVELFDKKLAWGAKASDYKSEIENAITRGCAIVLVELDWDLAFPADADVRWIDHHGGGASITAKTSLEQIFELFQFPANRWTRWLELVSANDRGHVAAMMRLGATTDELVRVRAADRAAQGVTAEEERLGRLACTNARQLFGGKLTLVELPHDRVATVTDMLDRALGGPGFENLLVHTPTAFYFFGDGQIVQGLAKVIPASWCGGELPERGFWGTNADVHQELVLSLIGDHLNG